MSFDDIKDHLERLFAYRPAGSSREQAAGLREALVEFKAALNELHATLETAERGLEQARKNAADYERRGRMATEIDDEETARIAEEHAAKARERVDLLERKVLVLRDEVTIAEREDQATKARFQRANQGLPLEAPRMGVDEETGEPVIHEEPFLDQRAKEAAVEAQLDMLKKKLGRE